MRAEVRKGNLRLFPSYSLTLISAAVSPEIASEANSLTLIIAAVNKTKKETVPVKQSNKAHVCKFRLLFSKREIDLLIYN